MKQIKLMFAFSILCLIAAVVYVDQYRIVIITHPTEYHFNADMKGYDIYTEDMKLVGRLNFGDNRTLDSLIIADNQ